MFFLLVVATILVTLACLYGTFLLDGCLMDEEIKEVAIYVLVVCGVLFPLGWVVLVVVWGTEAFLYLRDVWRENV